ncbi:hypothetical protein [Clostridiisalibacter paucivorans]|uniref:hypothetical protein n=1 Tax=Clostridiisalibacter paucivorans TaxID=408753 RepID=UPI000478D492|nr:hypothetical protein [Clostridiisalibacter paucivorans]
MFSKDIDIDYNNIMKNNVPLLINDEIWKKLFKDVKDRSISAYSEQLKELTKEMKETNRSLSKLKKEKGKVMASILNYSHRINNKHDENAVINLDESQQRLIEINEKIEELTFKSETLPNEIRQTNFELLEATIKQGYKILKEDGRKLEEANEEVEQLRNRLKVLIDEKNDYEERINMIYRFIHGIIGPDEMEKLDKKML